MKLMRWPAALSCLALAGCSAFLDETPQKVDPPPYVATSIDDLKRVAAERKLADPLEVAGPVAAHPISSAPWIICLRSGASEESRRQVYSVFFKGAKYDSTRLSAIVDGCEAQIFLPLKN
jgi:hypothetical protein